MPNAGVYLTAWSKVIEAENSDIHQFEIYRSISGQREHLCTFIAVNITHPQPCVVLDGVDFRPDYDGGEVAHDLTTMTDDGEQNSHYLRALRYSICTNGLVRILGKKPEELRQPGHDVLEAMAELAMPSPQLRGLIENTQIPRDYPRKGEVELSEIPRALNVGSFIEDGDLKRIVGSDASNQEEVEGSDLGEPIRTTKTGAVVSLDAFRNRLPRRGNP
jgi:hypothetical protein